ncbi:hypothetical protein FIV42_23740 [Persicimonas caeni]|uniref:Uncharacterized protein n=1 Tax=Persicimonas caeni TaxID=2292766 RepID=A0A4Y6Q079_PERCE|nr:hypothetical protein [Persicimonas caeni]QDG53647.1 hypothetical protein FIV42_23740 [Persicimonas caeni]QED34868.1 hypothetical protein FRD00_23735 [Persicimonas caeni]
MLVGTAATAQVQTKPTERANPDTPASTAITYQFNDPNPRVKNSVYSVYQADGVTMMVRHPRQEAPQFDKPTWYANAATDGRLVRVLQAHRPVLVKPGSGGYKPGTRERRRRRDDVSYVAYDNLETKLVRGEKDRKIAGQKTHHYILHLGFEGTRFDDTGEKVEQKKLAYEHHLWIAEDLPYSPAFAQPFRIIGRLFVGDDGTKLGEYIYDQVRPELEAKGLVLGMEFRQKGEKAAKYRLEAERFGKAKARKATLPEYPIIDQKTFAKITPLSFVSRMVAPSDEEAAGKSSFELSYKGDAKGDIEGTAVWGTNTHGDFALLLSLPSKFGSEQGAAAEGASSKEIFLLLMRPMHGRPEEGEYEVANVVDDIESLSKEELEALSQKFTVMAVIRERKKDAEHPDIYALTEAAEGKVTVSKGEEGLQGTIELELNGIALSTDASKASIEVKASFSARKALDNVGSSTITQVLTR